MKSLTTALRIFLFFTVLTGIAYPLLVTGIAQLVFPSKANGSIVYINKRPVGSELIGQSFDSPGIYFTPRPSATDYNPMPSGGSNLGLTSRKLWEQFEQRRAKFTDINKPGSWQEIPSEMLFASASGLDPHISPEAVMLQFNRICRSRHFSVAQEIRLRNVILRLTEPPQFLCLGQIRVNVLLLNLETDKIK
ncbi:MAG: potassium-transporting ATPase subunit KdpC [Bacteroidota bacterium]